MADDARTPEGDDAPGDDSPGGDVGGRDVVGGDVARPHGAGARLAVETWESLFRTQVALMRRFQADPIWDELTMREYDVLFSLTKGPADGMRLRDLNALILLSQPSLSRMVDRLAQRGLVERTVATDDARGVLVRLTDEGARVQRDIGRAHARTIARHVGGALDETELATLGALLDRLRAAQDPVGQRRLPGSHH